MCRILIVEDEGLIAFVLQDTLEERTQAESVVAPSSRAARRLIDGQRFDFALLDVEVVDGTTFDLARTLAQRRIPFVFTSGSDRSRVPADLADRPFVPKPYGPGAMEQIVRAVREVDGALEAPPHEYGQQPC